MRKLIVVNTSREKSSTVSTPRVCVKSERAKTMVHMKLPPILQINRRLVLMKAHFFLSSGALASVIPLLIPIYHQMGGTPGMIRTLVASLHIVKAVANLVVGFIGDRFKASKNILIIAIVIQAALFFSINFIPKAPSPSRANVQMAPNSTKVFCNPSSSTMALFTCDQDHLNTSLTTLYLSCIALTDPVLSDFLCATNFRQCTDYGKYMVSDMPVSGPRISLTASITSEATGLRPASGNTTCQEFRIRALSTTVDNRSIWTVNDSATCTDDGSVSLSCSVDSPVAADVPYVLGSANYRFIWIWIVCLKIWATSGIILSISDANLLNLLGDDRSNYGQTRLFASMGWGLTFALTAQLIDLVSMSKPQEDYTPGFYIFLVMMICDLLVVWPMQVVHSTDHTDSPVSDVLRLFKKLEFGLFAIGTVFVGVGLGLMWTCVIMFINELNGGDMVTSVYYAVECFASEIPFFFVSGWVITRLGHQYAMSGVLFMTGLKCVAFSFIYDAWYVVVVAIIHGFTYAGFYSTAATYARLMAPPGTSVSMQSLVQALLEGFGVGTGCLLGEIAYGVVGARQLFLIFGNAIATIGILHGAATFFLKKHTSSLNMSENDEEISTYSTE